MIGTVGQHVPFTADMVPSGVLPVVTIVVLVSAARHLGRPDNDWIRDQFWPQGRAAQPLR